MPILRPLMRWSEIRTHVLRILSGILAAFCSLTCSAEDLATFAAILPLTGNAADQGEWARRGLELARDQFARTHGRTVGLVYGDSQGAQPTTAVVSYRAIRARHGITAVLTYGSGVGMAIAPLANSDQVVQMGVAIATPLYSTPDDFNFRTFPSATLEIEFLTQALLQKRQLRNIAILNIENEGGTGVAKALTAALTANGGGVPFSASYTPQETDFRPLLLKVKRSQAQALFLASYPTDGALILKQARQLKLNTPIIGATAIIGGDDFFELAGSAADGMLVVSSIPNPDSPFFTAYRDRFPGESPAQVAYAARAYDGFMVTAEAAQACDAQGGSPRGEQVTDCIRKKLLALKDYNGASGRFSFDTNGDIQSSFGLYAVRGREFVRAE